MNDKQSQTVNDFDPEKEMSASSKQIEWLMELRKI